MKVSRIFPILLTGLFLVTIFGPTAPVAQAAALSDEAIHLSMVSEGSPMLASEMPYLFSAELPGLSVAAKKEYGCSLVSQSPKDWTKMKPRQSFDARWTVLNTGSRSWLKSGTDLLYISGTKMQTHGDTFDMPKNVGPDGKIALYVDMIAPKTKGTYTSYWGLSNGSQPFCRFYLIVTVK
jgi:hypothetical protein